jgi:hypothetical protein
MTPDEREQMHILCQRLAVEQECEKFIAYSAQMMSLLACKQKRLEARGSLPANAYTSLAS